MRILVAPQELKGSLRATDAASVIASALNERWPAVELDVLPLSDGGPGWVEAHHQALQGPLVSAEVLDALGTPVIAQWLRVGPQTAILEMTEASGLTRLAGRPLKPETASSFGTGQLIRAALDQGCRNICLGIGGSATNDGGTGALSALGVRFLDATGKALAPGGLALENLSHIDLSGVDGRLKDCTLTVATDVVNPLLGPQGASCVFGPQKGADAKLALRLDAALARLARVMKAQVGKDTAMLPRMGAAGGMSYGLSTLLDAALVSGFDLMAVLVNLPQRIREADWVICAEGRLDAQTLQGKGPGRLAKAVRESGAGKRVIAFVGALASDVTPADLPFDEIHVITPPKTPWSVASQQAAHRLRQSVLNWAATVRER